jgi:hypothetical protein
LCNPFEERVSIALKLLLGDALLIQVGFLVVSQFGFYGGMGIALQIGGFMMIIYIKFIKNIDDKVSKC